MQDPCPLTAHARPESVGERVAAPRVVALCTLDAGLDAIAHVLRLGHRIDAVVGLSPNHAGRESISGWTDVKAFGENWSVPAHYVERYDLGSLQDRRFFDEMSIDLLWVCGWQRLVPEWLLVQPTIGAIGAHGSPDGVVAGRGRSPQNWAIMLGCTEFEVSLFRLTPGVDDGPVIMSSGFRYLPTDDIAMSYRKNALCVASMMAEVIERPSLVDGALAQVGDAFYYPQRRPEDGIVDWMLGVEQIWAHCRALGRPYPGLRTTLPGGTAAVLWSCQPFDQGELTGKPGMVHAVFGDGGVLVEGGDGRILVTEYDCGGGGRIAVGDVLQGRPFVETLREICDRHTAREPERPVTPRITNLLAQS